MSARTDSWTLYFRDETRCEFVGCTRSTLAYTLSHFGTRRLNFTPEAAVAGFDSFLPLAPTLHVLCFSPFGLRVRLSFHSGKG